MPLFCDIMKGLLMLFTFGPAVRSSTITLPEYSLPETGCAGREITNKDVAGVFSFNAEYLSAGFRSSPCDVTISPKELQRGFNRVMFYFTKFDLGGMCSDNNLTIYDADRAFIYGLGEVLCGHNRSLENSNNIFTSTESEIHLQYRWSGRGRYNTGSFRMVFISFFDGPCTSEKNYFSCSTGKCISSKVSCREDLNYCGNGTEAKCVLQGAVQTILQTLGRVAKNLFILIAVIVGFTLLKRIFYGRLKEKYGSVRNFPLIRHIFGHMDNRARDESIHDDHGRSANIPERTLLTDSSVATGVEPPPYEEVSRNGSYSPHPGSVPLNSYGLPVPVPPPPSYDEVIANSNTYTQK